MKYRVDWVDFSIDRYGKCRKVTIEASSTEDALNKAYKKFPRMRLPSVSLIK
jgi:hypothetical protein